MSSNASHPVGVHCVWPPWPKTENWTPGVIDTICTASYCGCSRRTSRTDCIYSDLALDMSKAFDTEIYTNKKIILTHISNTIIEFIANYIKSRKVYTIFREHTSTQRHLKLVSLKTASSHPNSSTYTHQTCYNYQHHYNSLHIHMTLHQHTLTKTLPTHYSDQTMHNITPNNIYKWTTNTPPSPNNIRSYT